MAQRYRNLRRAQRERDSFCHDSSQRRPTSTGEFVVQVVAGMLLVGLTTWNVTPMILSLWHTVGVPPEQVARTEQSVYYAGCNEARAAGAAPIYRGSPGYREGMDGDGDGIACETRRW